MAVTITSMRKKGPIIICYTNDNRFYKIDLENNQYYGLSKHRLTSTRTICTALKHSLREVKEKNKGLCGIINYLDKNIAKEEVQILESFLSYPDLIDKETFYSNTVSFIIRYHNGKIPKGFINYCRQNQFSINYNSLYSFYVYKVTCHWSAQLVTELQTIKENANINIMEMCKFNKERCVQMLAMFKNSLKRYQIDVFPTTIMGKINNYLDKMPELSKYIDITKTLADNLSILANAANAEKSKIILNNEKQLLPLHDMVIDNYIFKIPLTMEDFTKEGEQQHNCVGYYYHDFIFEGRNLIYFLREVENPEKSFVTCRYSKETQGTVEAREAFNKRVSHIPDTKEFFDYVDTLIKKTLDKANES